MLYARSQNNWHIGKKYLHLISKISKELLEIYEKKNPTTQKKNEQGINRWLTEE